MISGSLISESPISSYGVILEFTGTATAGVIQFVGSTGLASEIGISIGALQGTYEFLGSPVVPGVGQQFTVRSSSLLMEGQVVILALDASLLPTEDFKLEHITGDYYKIVSLTERYKIESVIENYKVASI